MGDGGGGAFRRADTLHAGFQLLGERLHETGAQPAGLRTVSEIRLAHAVIGDGQRPVCTIDRIGHNDLTSPLVVWKGVLQGVDDEFRHDQAEAHRLKDDAVPSSARTLRESGRVSPIIDAARLSAEFRQVGADRDQLSVRGGLKLLLHRGDRHHALMGILEMEPCLL